MTKSGGSKSSKWRLTEINCGLFLRVMKNALKRWQGLQCSENSETLNHYSVQEYHTVWELNLDKFVLKIKKS